MFNNGNYRLWTVPGMFTQKLYSGQLANKGLRFQAYDPTHKSLNTVQVTVSH